MQLTGYVDFEESALKENIKYALSQYLDADDSSREPFKNYLRDAVEEDLMSDFYLDDKGLDSVCNYAKKYLAEIVNGL